MLVVGSEQIFVRAKEANQAARAVRIFGRFFFCVMK